MRKSRNSLDAKRGRSLRSKNSTANAVVANVSDSAGKRLLADARLIIDTARANAVRSVDFNRVMMYWHLGRRIFEEEQQGKDRAEYGAYLTRNLALALEPEYGSGFGVRQLEFCRKFYRVYPIANTLYSQLAKPLARNCLPTLARLSTPLA